MINLDCIRLVFVDNYNWEESENIFMINYKKIINKEKSELSSNIHTIMETLMVTLRIDSKETCTTIGNVYKNVNYSKRIYPISRHTHLELPYLVMNLSIS